MTCLTVTPVTAAEAVRERADLIVSHHPILFRGTKRITDATSEGAMLLDLIRAGIAVYSPHTAFDNTSGGINDILCRRLGLEHVTALRPFAGETHCKLVVFVPDKDLPTVRDAVFEVGAGVIGQYRSCSFRLAGTGTFLGSEASNPTVGTKGQLEEVEEWRLEVVCPRTRLASVVSALRSAHSYEEPAYDIYSLLADPARKSGAGRIGSLTSSVNLREFAHSVRRQLNANRIELLEPVETRVQRVAVVCGAGGEFLKDALRARADVLLTGEMRFHDQLDARAAGMSVLLPGHHATERPGVEELATILAREFATMEIWSSREERDPVFETLLG
jgi:dinuclear metal center YbgI/SA1388 family protein